MFKPVDPNYNFIEMEKKWLMDWYENGLVKKYLFKNKNSKKKYSFQDGPITANNPMGVHHAWGRTYKDLWQKFHNLLGFKQRFQNGFDCQGLWVEVEVEKELGLKSKKDIENLVPGDREASIAKFVQLCKDRVLKFAAIQTEQTKRLGSFMDWDNSYFTMSDENNYMIWHFLKKCYEHDWIYKGHESVPWCPRCETAISQHEMLTEDYKELVHESIYLELPLEGQKNEYLLVWTTTPWTIPANIAVAVDQKLEYSLVQGNSGDLFWVAKAAVERVFKKNYKEIIKTVKGKELVGKKYKGPFDNITAVKEVAKNNPSTFHTVIPTDDTILPISTEEGTGLVHTAVSAGVEDFKLGKKFGLPMIPVIADNADYLPGLDFLTGKNAKKHPRVILDYLVDREKNEKENWVFKIENYKHRYPACWRCKTELVWKVADEWYIAMDKPTSKEDQRTLRERMVEVTKKITWMPSFGLERELDWLHNMHDWLISKKNRYWGLALPIYFCDSCNSFEVLGSKEELHSRAVKGWKQFEGKTPHKPFIDEVLIACKNCKKEVRRIDDVGNPWLDAGIVPFSTVTENNKGTPLYLINKAEWETWFPVDFITESFPGQFKNWFYSLIAMSTALEDTNPFKNILGFATLTGEDGRPMHKSWGNSIEFNEGADKIGVDVMRWMYSRQNPTENMPFGYKKADEVRRQFYLILWNIYKFFVDSSNTDEWDREKLNLNSKNILDKWLLSRLTVVITNVREDLLAFNSKEAMREVEEFIKDISTWYIRRSRNRIWVNSVDNEDKNFFYSTLYHVLQNLSIIMSPVTPFISEEIYTNLTGGESVHLERYPLTSEYTPDDILIKQMIEARQLVEKAHALRKEKQIKLRQPLSSLESETTTPLDSELVRLVADEVNVKKHINKQGEEIKVVNLDVSLSPELKAEGEAREIMRAIQAERKKQGTKISERIDVQLTGWPKEFEDEIKQKTLVDNLTQSDEFKVIRKQS